MSMTPQRTMKGVLAGGGSEGAHDAGSKLPEGASHRAYRAIERKIVTLEFRPGSVLTEREIIEAVGFGRTPVRQAIQRLTLQGLMEVHPRFGVRIADIRPEDYPRAIEPRLTLEPLQARSAARYAGPRDRDAIASAMQGMMRSAERRDLPGFLDHDKAIDEAIAGASANPFLPRVLEPLEIHSRRFWVQYHGTSGLLESARAHAAVCEAIISGDGESAQAAMRALMDFLYAESKAISA